MRLDASEMDASLFASPNQNPTDDGIRKRLQNVCFVLLTTLEGRDQTQPSVVD